MYNALKYTERLEKAGFTRQEAEATTHMVLETMTDNFSTKDDLKLTELALRSDGEKMEISLRSFVKETEIAIRSDMKAMEQSIRSDMKIMELSLRAEIQELRAEMKQMESRLTLKLGGMLIAAIAVMEYLRSS